MHALAGLVSFFFPFFTGLRLAWVACMYAMVGYFLVRDISWPARPLRVWQFF
jgi:hypothetical protein